MRDFKKINQIKYLLLVIVFCFNYFATGIAQLPPKPPLWFSFNTLISSNQFNSEYNASIYCVGSNFEQFADRFNQPLKSVKLSSGSSQGAFLTYPRQAKLFGVVPNTDYIADNITISCWAYVDPTATGKRKIFFAGTSESGFGLYHEGTKIYMIRKAPDGQRYDYYFWAPAAFDANAGWYHVILTMGKRTDDGAKYSKLYIGKPNRVRYDQSGPRVWTTNCTSNSTTNCDLITDFAGGYAFLGQFGYMNGSHDWGFGKEAITESSVARIDDVVVWNGTILNEAQAYAFFKCMQNSSTGQSPLGNCWSTTSSLVEEENAGVAALASNTIPEKGLDELGLRVYPNPTSGDLRIQITQAGAEEARIRVLDLSGRAVFTQTYSVDSKFSEILVNDFKAKVTNSGLYLLEFVTAQRHSIVKIVVE